MNLSIINGILFVFLYVIVTVKLTFNYLLPRFDEKIIQKMADSALYVWLLTMVINILGQLNYIHSTKYSNLLVIFILPFYYVITYLGFKHGKWNRNAIRYKRIQ